MATPFAAETKQEPGISGKVLLFAALAVVVLVGIAAVVTLRRPASGSGMVDPYAANLAISKIELSEATNGAGGKLTYVDGVVTNQGSQTLNAATVQITFSTDDGQSALKQTTPLTLIRTRQPYVDLEPVSAEPLKPGSSHDFRLIFESVPEIWNQKPPVIQVTRADVR